MSDKAIAWTTVIIVVVMFIICGAASLKGKIDKELNEPTVRYTSKCAWCDNQRLPGGKYCGSCEEIVKALRNAR